MANILPLTACEPIEELPYLHENLALVPHYLPGKNPFVNEVTMKHNIPLEAVMGGPKTIYPEYRKKLKDRYVLPPPCTTGCGGPPGPPASPAAGRDARPPFAYQYLAERASELWRLGMSASAIASALGVSDKTVTKALRYRDKSEHLARGE